MLVVAVAFFAGGDGDGEAVLVGGEGAGGVGGVAAGRVVGEVEVDDEGAGFVDAVGGEAGGEEAAGAVGGGAAGEVAEVEEEGFSFDERFELIGLAVDLEFGIARSLLFAGLAEDVEDAEGPGGGVGNPLGGDAEAGVGRVPVEAAEVDAGGGVGVLNAEVVAVAAMDDGDADIARDELGGIGGVVGRECGGAGDGFVVDENGGGEAFGWGDEVDVAVVLLESAEMLGEMLELELVVGCGADGGVAVGEPLEGDEGEPAVGLREVVGVGFAPVVEVGGGLGVGARGKERREKKRESESDGSEGHG